MSLYLTHASVSEVLQMCAEDAEETLYQLGFGCEEPQVTARIPARFFTFPSKLKGINFRLFLESQLRRIREEDPSLSLAGKNSTDFIQNQKKHLFVIRNLGKCLIIALFRIKPSNKVLLLCFANFV